MSLEVNTKKKIILGIAVIVLIIAAVSIIKLITYISFNSKVLKEIESEAGQVVTIKSNTKNISLQNKVVEALKNNNKYLKIEYKGGAITIPTENISKKMRVVGNIKNETTQFSDFQGIKCLYLEKGIYSSICLKLPKYLADTKIVDIYMVKENNVVEINQKAVKLGENGTVTIDAVEGASGYIVINVPIKDIIVGNGTDIANINKNQPTDIETKFVPVNATAGENTYIVDENSIISIVDGKIVGNEIGDKSIKIVNCGIEKEIKVHVDNYVTDIIINAKSVNVEVGKTYKLSYTITPDNAINKEISFESSDSSIAKIEESKVVGVAEGNCKIIAKTTSGVYFEKQIDVNVKKNVAPSYGNDIKEPTYIQGILIANKTYALPSSYNPGLDSKVVAAFNELKAAAANEGLNIWLASGFRSYNSQYSIYNNYVATRGGQAVADTFSARAGHSEHQTGLAIDVNSVSAAFANTDEGKWLAINAHKYGFIIRYPAGKQEITGYKYEPWHIRYLGVETATDVYNSGLCLEEYLGITSQYAD